jgi:hypothetical protein
VSPFAPVTFLLASFSAVPPDFSCPLEAPSAFPTDDELLDALDFELSLEVFVLDEPEPRLPPSFAHIGGEHGAVFGTLGAETAVQGTSSEHAPMHSS